MGSSSLVAKLGVSLGGAIVAVYLAMVGYPLLPPLLSSLRGYLSPPCIFLFINFIIFVILSLPRDAKSVPRHHSWDPPKILPETSPPPPPPPPSPPPPPETGGAAVEHDPAEDEDRPSMDDTWMAIMRRKKEMNLEQPKEEKQEEEEEEDHTEMDRQFEEFIRKVNDQMKLGQRVIGRS